VSEQKQYLKIQIYLNHKQVDIFFKMACNKIKKNTRSECEGELAIDVDIFIM